MFGFGISKKQEPEKENGISGFAQQLIDMLGCPCTHFPKGTDPSKVLNAYDDAFAKREQGGYTPLIIGIDNTLLEVVGEFCTTHEELNANRDKMLATPQINAQKWFAERLAEHKDCMSKEDWAETVGEVEYRDGDVSKTFSGFVDFGTPRRSDECILALIPTKEPWEIFAWLPFGGWNECPAPEEILWLAKYWYERYNAIPAVMTRDVLEFSAPPINDKETALGLALEQFAACPDIVYQGVDTIGRLAGGLMKSSVWYFWWD